jgi:hypothetical protein
MPNEELMREMDDAAAQAKTELLAHLDEWRARDVAKWWGNWYLKAGHKRLGRLLVQVAKETKKSD